MPKRYPPQFRRRALTLIRAGKSLADVARDLDVSQAVLYKWREQDLVDRGLRPGRSTAESAELAAAHRRIRELEAEVEILRRASVIRASTEPRVQLLGLAWVNGPSRALTSAFARGGRGTSGTSPRRPPPWKGRFINVILLGPPIFGQHRFFGGGLMMKRFAIFASGALVLGVLAGSAPRLTPATAKDHARVELTRLRLLAEAAALPSAEGFIKPVSAPVTTVTEAVEESAPTAPAEDSTVYTGRRIATNVNLEDYYDQIEYFCMVSTESGCKPVVDMLRQVIDTSYACVAAVTNTEQGAVDGFALLNCESLAHFAEAVAGDLVVLIQDCANQTNSTCKTVVNLLVGVAMSALRCVNEAANASGAATPLYVDGDRIADCAGIVQTVRETADAAAALVQECADRTNPTCETAVVLVAAAASMLNRCIAGSLWEEGVGWTLYVPDEPLVRLDCGALVRQSRQTIDDTVRLAQDCAAENDRNCATALALVRAAGFTVRRCVEEAGGLGLVKIDLGRTDLANVDCGALVREAAAAVNTAVRYAEACADGSDPTCATATALADAAANTALGCIVDAADEAVVDPALYVGTQLADLDCDGLVRTARQFVDTVVLVVQACANATDPTCQQVNELLAAGVAAAADCASTAGVNVGDTSGSTVDCEALLGTLVGTLAGLAAQAVGTVTGAVGDALGGTALVKAVTTLVYAAADDAGTTVYVNVVPPSDDDLLGMARDVLATVVTDTELPIDPRIPVSHEQLVAYTLDAALYFADVANGETAADPNVLLGRLILVKTAVESALRSVEENNIPPEATSEVENVGSPLRLPVGFEVPDVAEQVATHFGSRFSGSWLLDEIVQTTLAVGVTDVSASDTHWVTQTFGVNARYLRLVPVTYSEGQLDGYQNTLLAWLDSSPDMNYFFGAGPAADENKLVFTFTREVPAFRAYAATAVPPGALRVQIRPGLVSTATDSYESYPPYKAGKRVREFTVGSCTSGFAYYDYNNGRPYGSTAGHCALVNRGIYTDYNNRDWIGDAVSARFYNRADNKVDSESAIYKIFVVDYASNKLYVNSSLSRSVTGRVTKAGMTNHLDDRFQGVGCRRGVLRGRWMVPRIGVAYPTSNRRFSWTPTWTPSRPHSTSVSTTG